MIDMSIILYTVALMFVIVVLASISKDEKFQRPVPDKEKEKEKEKIEKDYIIVNRCTKVSSFDIIDVEPHVFKYINRMSLRKELLGVFKEWKIPNQQIN